MRETEARRADLEREHAESQHHLREKLAGRYQGPESVEALQSKIRELEKKTELQMVKHEELSLELTSLKRARSRGPSALDHASHQHQMPGMATATWPPAGSEIDRLMAKIEMDRYRTYDEIFTLLLISSNPQVSEFISLYNSTSDGAIFRPVDVSTVGSFGCNYSDVDNSLLLMHFLGARLTVVKMFMYTYLDAKTLLNHCKWSRIENSFS